MTKISFYPPSPPTILAAYNSFGDGEVKAVVATSSSIFGQSITLTFGSSTNTTPSPFDSSSISKPK